MATKPKKTKKPNILVLWGTQDSFFYMSDQKPVISALKSAAKAGGSFCWKQ